MDQRKVVSFRMPNAIINDTALSASATVLGMIFYSHRNANGYCKKSYTDLSQLSGLCASTVRNAINELCNGGYITYTRTYRWSKRHKRVVYGKNAYQCNMELVKNNYTLIPRSWLDDMKKLSGSAACILLYIASLAAIDNKQHRAWPSIKTISKRVGVGCSTVKRALHELKNLAQLMVQPCRNLLNGEYSDNSYFICSVLETVAATVNPVCQKVRKLITNTTGNRFSTLLRWIMFPIQNKVQHWLALLRGVGPKITS